MDEEPKVKPQYSMEVSGSLHSFKNIELEESYIKLVLRPMAERILKSRSKLPVLDLACGQGESADYLGTRGIKTVRFDLSTKVGKKQREKNFVLGDMTVLLPFKDNSFSGIHIKDAVVHVDNKRNLFEEVSRVLMSGGRVAITTVSKESPETMEDGIKYYPVNISKLVNEGNKAGLVLEQKDLWIPLNPSKDWYGKSNTARLVLTFKNP